METAIYTELGQWLAGDEASFEHIFRYYYRRMLSFSIRFLKNRQQAEEITMDVLLKVWQKKDTLENAATFQSYLFVMLRNELVSFSRKKKQVMIPVDLLIHELADHSQEYQRDMKSAVEEYQLTISRLSPKRREVFRLSREEGLTHAEIADRLGLSIFTVKNHIKDALQILRAELKHPATISALYGTLLLDFVIR